jgi:hypothetical protein
MASLRQVRCGFAVALVGLLTGATPPSWRVTLRHFGPVRFGMTPAEASAVLGVAVETDSAELADGCAYTTPAALPAGTSFMVLGGRIARVDVEQSGVHTVAGVGVGSTEAEVRQRYPGQIRTEPHPYDAPEGHYLVFTPRDSTDTAYGLIFETDGQRVTSYRAGLHEAVQLIEGCD